MLLSQRVKKKRNKLKSALLMKLEISCQTTLEVIRSCLASKESNSGGAAVSDPGKKGNMLTDY